VRISDATICWTPNCERYPAGFRGKARIFPSSARPDEITPFARRGGHADPRAHDPRLEVRQAYALMIAMAMSERDGLDLASVHQLMLSIEEYASGCAEELDHVDSPSIKS
jgi:hypothetical protein